MRVPAFRVLVGLVVLVALGFFATGAWLVLTDLEQRGEMFDGLGMALGLGLMVVSTLGAAMAVTALVLVRRRSTMARVLGVLLALTGVGLVYPLGVDTAWGWWLLPFPLALLVLSLLPEDDRRTPAAPARSDPGRPGG